MYSKYDKFYFEELREQCVIELWHEFSQYGLSRFRGDSKESTWIYQIALHAVANYFCNPHNDQLQMIERPHEQLIVTYNYRRPHQSLDILILVMKYGIVA